MPAAHRPHASDPGAYALRAASDCRGRAIPRAAAAALEAKAQLPAEGRRGRAPAHREDGVTCGALDYSAPHRGDGSEHRRALAERPHGGGEILATLRALTLRSRHETPLKIHAAVGTEAAQPPGARGSRVARRGFVGG